MSATPWTNATAASVSRKNKTSVITDSGTNLALLDKTKYKIVTCNSTGGGFTADHTYYFGDDGTTVIDLTELTAHTHNNEADGGGLEYVYINTPEVLDLWLQRPTDFQKALWNQTVTGTGTIEDGGGGASRPYIRLRPNGTSGSGATISWTQGFPLVYFSAPSIFSFIGNFETASSLAFHAGVNADDVTAADSNTIKYQAEVCTATNNNWWIRTATGSANSASDAGVAISTNEDSVKIVYDSEAATPNVKISISASGEFTKTTNIPISSTQTTIGNMIKFSVKNSTAADRPYRVKGCRLSYRTLSAWTYGGV